jgi:CubicO group peptidase (beta-lactamase class C family)
MTAFPPAGQWPRIDPGDAGFDGARLAEAIAFAGACEVEWPRDLAAQPVSDDPPQYAAKIGPVRERGGPAGVVVRHGAVVAEWGDVERVDLTFSVSKSYLATVAGLAFDRGRLHLDGRVAEAERDVRFEYSHRAIAAIDALRASGQDARLHEAGDEPLIDGFDGANASITWRHLLQQTSEWQGWLWGKPDVVDWNRDVGSGDARQVRQAPGRHWEYNDVRVNRAALALLASWQEPLPAVLRREVMDPIGCRGGWQWHGYGDHSTVLVNGEEVESVSGGAHWGGGVWASTLDHARFGWLFANVGQWDGRRIVSPEWCREMIVPCEHNREYGLMWWLNTGHGRYGAALSEATFGASGAGGNAIVCAPDRGLVIVTRWCADVTAVVDRVARSLAD